MATRQTLRDYLLNIGSTATSISLPVDPGSDGVVDVGDDLGIEPSTSQPLMNFDDGKSLLASYTSYLTEFNDFPIAPDVHAAPSPVRGAALERAEDAGALRVFADSGVGENALALDRSNSAMFDAAGYPAQTIVDKIGAGTAASGNELLSSTVAAEANSDLAPGQTLAVKASFSVLNKYNNFAPTPNSNTFAKDTNGVPRTASDFENSNTMRFQVGSGEYNPQISEISEKIDQADLANIARSMILKAAGWDTSEIAGDSKNPETAFNNIDTESITQFPSFERSGVQTVDSFRAQDAYGMPENADGSSFLSGRGDVIQKESGEAKYTRTRGSMYTPDTPFAESQALSEEKRIQSLQAGIAMIGLGVLINKKLENMSFYTGEMQVNSDKVLRGPYYLGTSRKSNVTVKTRALIRSFMFQTGIYSYTNCVREGLYACFGFSSLKGSITVETANLASVYSNEIQNISDNFGSRFFNTSIGLSQGFWRSVTESAIRTIKSLEDSTSKLDSSDYVTALLNMKDSLAVRIMNVFASIGYQRLIIQGVTTESGDEPQNPYDMNKYPTTPGTRQMKSRDGQLLSNASLAWRNSALPSAFILPVEALAASIDMDYLFDAERGANPIKGMLGSTMYDKTYVKAFRNSNTIPSIAAKLIEDRLGAEYIPFYFRDLRTNEILAFHAFLETLTDGFSANFAESKGFGRADAVQNYSSTSRSIGITFWLVATSKEDFDEMWFKINKLVTLVYPQYTRGRLVTQKDDITLLGTLNKLGQNVRFEQPFSQVAGGTPVVRMRVGDLIKTNYTRSNFARLFGVGNDTFDVATASENFQGELESGSTDVRFLPFLLYAASPMELTLLNNISTGGAQGAALMAIDAITELAAYLFENGFVNPLLSANRKTFLKNGASFGSEGISGFFEEGPAAAIDDVLEVVGLRSKLLLKARGTPYQTSDNKLLRLRRPVFVNVSTKSTSTSGTIYNVQISDNTVGNEFNGKTLNVSAADLYVDAGQIVDITSLPGFLLALAAIKNPLGTLLTLASNAAATGLEAASTPIGLPLAETFGSMGRTFTSPYNNQLTKAFEDRMGEGLAGVIKNMQFTWMESPWETDWNSRAPTACKITLQFTPIHDIAPGLDSNGFNRAPVYNVGQIMNDTFGQPRSDGGSASRYFYKQTGAVAENSKNITKI